MLSALWLSPFNLPTPLLRWHGSRANITQASDGLFLPLLSAEEIHSQESLTCLWEGCAGSGSILLWGCGCQPRAGLETGQPCLLHSFRRHGKVVLDSLNSCPNLGHHLPQGGGWCPGLGLPKLPPVLPYPWLGQWGMTGCERPLSPCNVFTGREKNFIINSLLIIPFDFLKINFHFKVSARKLSDKFIPIHVKYNLELNVTEKIIFACIYRTNEQKLTFSAKVFSPLCSPDHSCVQVNSGLQGWAPQDHLFFEWGQHSLTQWIATKVHCSKDQLSHKLPS